MIILEVLIIVLSVALIAGTPKSLVQNKRHSLALAGLLIVFLFILLGVLGHRWQFALSYILIFGAAVATGLRAAGLNATPRPILKGAAVTFAMLAALLAALVQYALPVPNLPTPRGEYAVGVRTYAITDATRADLEAEFGDRELLVRIWYPASPDSRGAAPRYVTAREAKELSARLQNSESGFVLNHFTRINIDAVIDAAPINNAFPVLVFSHGFSGLLNQSTAIIQDVVSRGFVVVAVGHPGGAAALEFPDGTFRPLADIDLEAAMLDEETLQIVEQMATVSDYDTYRGVILRALEKSDLLEPFAHQWSADQSFVIDQIEAEAFPELAGAMNAQNIGVFGHSFGGSATALTCSRDARCDAALNLDGMQYGGLIDEDMREPFLMVYTNHPNEGVLYNDIMYRADPTGDDPFNAVVVADTQHHDPTDLSFVLRAPLKAQLPRNPALGQINPNDSARVFSDLIVGFFNEHLNGTTGSLQTVIDEHDAVQRHTPQWSSVTTDDARSQ